MFTSRPSGTPARAGALIAPDWRGRGPFFRQQSQLISQAGLDVALVDLYRDGLYATDESLASPLLKGLVENRSSGVSRLLGSISGGAAHAAKIIVLGYAVRGSLLARCDNGISSKR